MSRHLDYKRQKMIAPYQLSINTRGREHFNRIIVPHFAEFFKDGDKILFVGKHPLWDYSPLFNSPAKQCEYVVSDIEPSMEPDVVDDIGASKFETNSFDGVILVGVYDSLTGGATKDKVTSEVHRITKPGGRILIADSGTPNGSYNPCEAWPEFIVDEVHYTWGSHMMEEGHNFYGERENQGIMLIVRNKI